MRCAPVPRRSYLLAASALLIAFAFQGTRGLYEPSEGRYAEVAREMRESGRYLEPTLAHRPHWTKPPLTYWGIAGGLAIAGDNPWGVRAYDAIAFTLTVLGVAAIGSTLWNPETGFLAGLVFLSSPFPVVGANVATADTLLALWTTLALLAYVRAWKGARSASWARLMWLMFGLGFFTKGPPALLPLLALVVFHWIARRPFRLLDVAGAALFVVSGFWWYALMVARHPELASYFFAKEIVARNATNTFHRNGHWYGPFAVYLPVLLIGPGVWLVDGFRMARRHRLFSPRGLLRALSARSSAGSLLLLWLLLPLVFFALSRSRLPLYLLPLYPAVAIAIARGMGASADARAVRRRALRMAAASLIVLIALKGFVAYRPSEQDATRLYREAVRAAGPEAQFTLYAEPELYGFEFYVGKGLQRVSRTGTEPWADGSIDEALASRDPGRAFALLAGPRFSGELESALRSKDVRFERNRVASRDLFVIRP
jgi:4-amino-4-deoxy-L-arabinose transferase-like glycosyltransferase